MFPLELFTAVTEFTYLGKFFRECKQQLSGCPRKNGYGKFWPFTDFPEFFRGYYRTISQHIDDTTVVKHHCCG